MLERNGRIFAPAGTMSSVVMLSVTFSKTPPASVEGIFS